MNTRSQSSKNSVASSSDTPMTQAEIDLYAKQLSDKEKHLREVSASLKEKEQLLSSYPATSKNTGDEQINKIPEQLTQ